MCMDSKTVTLKLCNSLHEAMLIDTVLLCTVVQSNNTLPYKNLPLSYKVSSVNFTCTYIVPQNLLTATHPVLTKNRHGGWHWQNELTPTLLRTGLS